MIRKAIIAVFTLATVASVWVWIASYGGFNVWREFDSGEFDSGRTSLGFVATKGRCGLVRYVGPPDETPTRHRRTRLYLASYWFKRPGVWGKQDHMAAWVRAWVPCAIFGSYPFYSLVRSPARRRRRRREQGLCLDCGYDLTGNVTGVCSECGVMVEERGADGGMM